MGCEPICEPKICIFKNKYVLYRFNVPTNGSMEDPVEVYILEKKLDNDRDLWEDECWGFYDELDLKLFNEEIFFLTLKKTVFKQILNQITPHIKVHRTLNVFTIWFYFF